MYPTIHSFPPDLALDLWEPYRLAVLIGHRVNCKVEVCRDFDAPALSLAGQVFISWEEDAYRVFTVTVIPSCHRDEPEDRNEVDHCQTVRAAEALHVAFGAWMTNFVEQVFEADNERTIEAQVDKAESVAARTAAILESFKAKPGPAVQIENTGSGIIFTVKDGPEADPGDDPNPTEEPDVNLEPPQDYERFARDGGTDI